MDLFLLSHPCRLSSYMNARRFILRTRQQSQDLLSELWKSEAVCVRLVSLRKSTWEFYDERGLL